MKIQTITYQRVKNLGNYESERMEMTAQVDEDDDPNLVALTLKSMVAKELNVEPTANAKEHKTEPEDGF